MFFERVIFTQPVHLKDGETITIAHDNAGKTIEVKKGEESIPFRHTTINIEEKYLPDPPAEVRARIEEFLAREMKAQFDSRTFYWYWPLLPMPETKPLGFKEEPINLFRITPA